VLGLVAMGTTTRAADDLKAFPLPGPGMVRYVLRVSKAADEYAMKVQLIAGKTVPVDDRNVYHFGGRIQASTIEGWGFTRHDVPLLGPMAGTRMAVEPGAPKVEKFVTLGGEPYLIRYNSRAPIVVYAPEGAEVRYRIWAAAPETKSLAKE
jgi:ecotin